MAPPPVLHQQHRTDRTSRHHPPPARDHRDRLRRPHRRPDRPPALGPLRRQQCLGHLRGDDPQPAARRRHPDQPAARPRPRRDPAPTHHHRPSPNSHATTPQRAAPTRALALGPTLGRPLDRGIRRDRTTNTRLNPRPPPPKARPETPWNSWTDQQTHAAPTQPTSTEDQLRRIKTIQQSAPRIEAKTLAGWAWPTDR